MNEVSWSDGRQAARFERRTRVGRRSTLSHFAALNTQTGEVLGQTVPRHTSAAFVDFLTEIVSSQPRGREIHVILDNLSTHKLGPSTRFSTPIRRCIFTSRRPMPLG